MHIFNFILIWLLIGTISVWIMRLIDYSNFSDNKFLWSSKDVSNGDKLTVRQLVIFTLIGPITTIISIIYLFTTIVSSRKNILDKELF